MIISVISVKVVTVTVSHFIIC